MMNRISRFLPKLVTVTVMIGVAAQPGSVCADAVPSVSQRFASADVTEKPDFQKHVVPLLGRLGCNGRNCHGSFQGRGDLQLSLFGYDFEMDHRGLTGTASSGKASRIHRQHPDQSLILNKPMMVLDHEGGQRFEVDSWQHHLLQKWIADGAEGTVTPRTLSHLQVEPAEVVFRSDGATAKLRVVAVWADDQQEDVTPLCRFRTNDDSVVTVNADGRLTSIGAGDTHVVVFYDNGVAAVPVLRPQETRLASGNAENTDSDSDPESGIDRFVLEKLKKLQISPSTLCTDAEFLRRVSLDLTGTLPAPNEIEEFLDDASDDKRSRKVDELLQRPAYAAWWTNKLCDFTGCNPSQQAELGQETSTQWYMWIYDRVRRNVPYRELVRGIVLARSREDGQSYDEYAAQTSAYFRKDNPSDFAQRATMPHYWTRRSMQKAEDAAQAFAHNFLGIRLQCAQCHKHPFAPWTQDDFQQFSRFFETIEFGVEPGAVRQYRELAKQVGLQVKNDSGTAVRNDILKHAQKGRTIPWRELYFTSRDDPAILSLLRSGMVELHGQDDPRQFIIDWMDKAENPWFARAFVNRVWAGYFRSGIVDPPDDLNPANPPSHPALLDWLVQDFVDHGFDMKQLHRRIVTSDTYQRSWIPNDTNRNDRRNFSRAIPRRLPAEVVYDAVKQALVSSDRTQDVRTDLTRRATGHLSMRLAGTYAMQVFGKPDRAVNCDCERDNQPTLLQSIFLQNDPLMDQRLQDSGWLQEIEAQSSAGFIHEPKTLIREAWLRTVSRPPTAAEFARAAVHLQSADSTADGMRDLLWALLNTKEFILNR